MGPNVSRASRAQDRGGDAPAAPLRRPCRRGTRPSCPCGPSPCGSGRGDEGGWVSAGRARFPRDDRVSVGTRTGPKKNCKDPTSAVAGDEAQSRDCRQASCLVTFAFTRGSHLQPPAVVVLLGLIKACLDLAGVRELIVGVVVRSKLNSPKRVRNCVSRIFFANLPNRIRWLYASSFGATRVPRAADVDRDGVGGSVTVPGVGTRGVPTPSPGVPRVAARPGAPRDRRCACLAVSAISRRVLRVRGPRRRPSSASHRLTLFVFR